MADDKNEYTDLDVNFKDDDSLNQAIWLASVHLLANQAEIPVGDHLRRRVKASIEAERDGIRKKKLSRRARLPLALASLAAALVVALVLPQFFSLYKHDGTVGAPVSPGQQVTFKQVETGAQLDEDKNTMPADDFVIMADAAFFEEAVPEAGFVEDAKAEKGEAGLEATYGNQAEAEMAAPPVGQPRSIDMTNDQAFATIVINHEDGRVFVVTRLNPSLVDQSTEGAEMERLKQDRTWSDDTVATAMIFAPAERASAKRFVRDLHGRDRIVVWQFMDNAFAADDDVSVTIRQD